MTQPSYFPLPLTIEDITAEWLTAALRSRVPDVTVHSVRIVDLIRSTSTKIRLRLEMNEAGKRAGIPETIILKGGFEPHSREMAFMHEKEARGYRDVFPAFGLPTPACYFADYAPDQRHGIVLMEDLVARGVSFCDPLKPQTYEQVSRRLETLARFHAKSWGTQEFLPGGQWQEIETQFGYIRPYLEHYFEPAAWARFTALPQGAAASVRFLDRDWAVGALDRMTHYSLQLPHSILHADTHLGNLYIDTDGTPGFFDSLTSRGPGMLEVAYHIGCAVDSADRPRWEVALVRDYLVELGRNGVAAPSLDEAMYQYAVFLAYGMLIFLINETFFQSGAINTAYVARFNAAMLQHDTFGLLQAIDPGS
jgi:Ecdysteroid kinase-like family